MESWPRFMSCHRQDAGLAACGLTLAPTRARCRPSTMTRSSGFRPSRITRRPSSSGPRIDRPRLHGVVVLDHEHDLARLIGRDRRIRQQQRLIGRASDQPDPAELSGQDREVLVRDRPPGRAACRSRRSSRLSRKSILPSCDGLVSPVSVTWTGFGVIARTRTLALELQPVVFEIGRLIHVEIDVDRIERDDRGQQRRTAFAALHEIADADEMAADPARRSGPAHG